MHHHPMKRYFVRPAKPEDIEAVYGLIAKQNKVDYGNPLRTIDDLRKTWETIDIETDTCTAHADGQLAGYAELLEGDSLYIFLADRGNTDLAFQLMTILEERALLHKTEKVKLFTKISEKNNTLLQLFASKGYRSNLSFLMMELEMDEPPPAPEPVEGIEIRPFVQGQDEQATYRADEEAAEDKGYHDPLSYEAWVKRMGMDKPSFDPSIWFLAWDGNELAGVALNVYDREANIGWVDHLSVRRAWRRRGIGRALLIHSFREFYARGIRRVKLNVDSKSLTNAPRLYEQVGMKAIQQYHIYTKEIDTVPPIS
ncbi:MAG TPA: GNAT family N-acetyltransferase [Anaerolineales bacterium]|nr:GNAT family N-acetyltransferase [Anaerolineales bacterium]